MLTAFDKAIVPILAGLLAWLNQKYGFKFDTSPETLTIIVSAITTAIVYFVPNKPASTS